MTKHALERLQFRYNQHFDWTDLHNIVKGIRNNKCYILSPGEAPNSIVVLVVYKNIPMKLVYGARRNKKNESIITALPIDVDEFNSHLSEIIPIE